MRKTLLLGLTVLIVVAAASGLIFNELSLTKVQSSISGQVYQGTDDPYDAFLKIDGIEGESQDADHGGWIEIVSYSFGVSQPAAGAASGSGRGKPTLQDFTFVMKYSKASPKLFQAVCTGESKRRAVLAVCRLPDRKEFLTITLSGVTIASYKTSGTVLGDDKPTEEITLKFTRIDVSYQRYDSAGNKVGSRVTAGWDLTQNRKT